MGLTRTTSRNSLPSRSGDITRGANDAIVGSNIATNFNLVVGSRIKIGPPNTDDRPTVRVSGILPARGFASDGVNTDNAIIVPDTWYTDQYGNKDVYDQVNVIVKNVDTIGDVETAIDEKVNRKTQVITDIRCQPAAYQHYSDPRDDHDLYPRDRRYFACRRRRQHLQRDDDVGQRTGAGDRYPPLYRD